jgi:hypothetical protein
VKKKHKKKKKTFRVVTIFNTVLVLFESMAKTEWERWPAARDEEVKLNS